VVGGDFHQNDPDAVGILDPHLGQSPWLGYGLTQHAHARRQQPLVLGGEISHLEPDHDAGPGSAITAPRHFEKASAQKEDQAGIAGCAELAVNREAQHIPVKLVASAQAGRTQQDPAA